MSRNLRFPATRRPAPNSDAPDPALVRYAIVRRELDQLAAAREQTRELRRLRGAVEALVVRLAERVA